MSSLEERLWFLQYFNVSTITGYFNALDDTPLKKLFNSTQLFHLIPFVPMRNWTMNIVFIPRKYCVSLQCLNPSYALLLHYPMLKTVFLRLSFCALIANSNWIQNEDVAALEKLKNFPDFYELLKKIRTFCKLKN